MRKYKRVAVKSANTIGKSFIAADVVLDFLLTNKDSVVVTTAPTFQQVETILWREIRSAVYHSKYPLGAQVLQTELKFSDKWYAIGISTDNPVNFQGKHSESGKLLVVIDEASGFPQDIWEMIEALHPSNILAIGNPTDIIGPFFDCFNGPAASMWHQITITANECLDWQRKNGRIPGLVSEEWVTEMQQIHGKGSDWYRVHVDAEFPLQAESALINREWVDRARRGVDADGLPLDEEKEHNVVRILSCDLATKHGNNETILTYRYGHTFKNIYPYKQQSATFIRDEIGSLFNKHDLHITVFDGDGLGESFGDFLAQAHIPFLEFHGGYGQKAIEHVKFRNLRTQFYWMVARKFEKGLYDLRQLPQKEFELLRSQLCSIKAKKDDPMGRIQIETKEDLAARSIKSPDYADSFMMSEFAYFMRKMSDLRPVAYGGI